MQLSGHRNLQSLGAYKSASLSHQRQMSDTLSGRRSEPNSASITHGSSEVTSLHRPSSVSNVLSSVISSSSSNLQAVFAGANISSITGCTVQIMSGYYCPRTNNKATTKAYHWKRRWRLVFLNILTRPFARSCELFISSDFHPECKFYASDFHLECRF